MFEWLTALKLRLMTLARRRQLERDLDDEMSFHQEMRNADESQGISRRFGNVTLLKEECREQWTFTGVESVLSDVRYATRRIRKAPVFSMIAILVIALGIGANTAIFSLLDAVMLKSLPVNEPQNLAQIRLGVRREVFSHPIWEYIRGHQEVFDETLAYSTPQFNLASGGEQRFVNGLYVSGNYFSMLGVKAMLGRTLMPSDDMQGGATDVGAVISYGFWQKYYGGSRDVVGKKIAVDGHAFTIVGVTPAGFFGLRVGSSFDLALPLIAAPIVTRQADLLEQRGSSWLRVMGRLRTGMPIEKAEAGIQTMQAAIREATLPAGMSADAAKAYLRDPFTLIPGATGSSSLRQTYADALFVLMGVVGLVLLVACANIASLLLARASARTREIAVRISIGASRLRLIRQLLIESFVLGFCGAALGLGFATWASRLLLRALSTETSPVFLDLALDWRILGFTFSAALLTSLLFGIVPAVRATHRSPADTLRQMAGSAGTSQGRIGAGRWLVSLQAGLSLVLIFGAVLFLRSYRMLVTTDPGFNTARVTLFNVDFRGVIAAKGRGALSLSLFDQVADALRAIPGVQSVAYSATVPVGDTSMDSRVQVDGYQPRSDRDGTAFTNQIGEGYFTTLGTAVLDGRDFDRRDREQGRRTVIVNEAFAKKFFSGRNPIGQTFGVRMPNDMQIVGVVTDAKYNNMRETVPPTFYRPITSALGPMLVFSVKTSRSPATLSPSLTAAIGSIDKRISFNVRSFQSQVDDSLIQERLIAILSAFFGTLALVIAAIGLAGLVSYSVTRRRAEIGIRAALGASPSSLVRLVMSDVVAITIGGLVVGGILCFAGGRLVATMLYRITPNDPLTLVVAASTLTIAAILAGYIPARRAARIDPMQCLRSE